MSMHRKIGLLIVAAAVSLLAGLMAGTAALPQPASRPAPLFVTPQTYGPPTVRHG